MIQSITHTAQPDIKFAAGEEDPCAAYTEQSRGVVTSITQAGSNYDVHFGSNRHVLLPAAMYHRT